MHRFLSVLGILVLLLPQAYAQSVNDDINELRRQLSRSSVDTGRVSLLLKIAGQHVNAAYKNHDDLDSALAHANAAMKLSWQLNTDKWKGQCYLMYSKICMQQPDTIKGREYVLKAGELFKSLNDKNGMADACVELSSYYGNGDYPEVIATPSFQQRIRLMEQAEELYEQAGNKLKEANVLKQLGQVYMDAETDEKKALPVLFKAQAIYQQLHYDRLEDLYRMISRVFQVTGDNEKAIQYGLLALKTADALHDSDGIAEIYNNLGQIYFYLEQYEKSREYYQQSFSFAEQSDKHIELLLTVANSLINANNRTGRVKQNIEFLAYMEKKHPVMSAEQQILYDAGYLACYQVLKEYKTAAPYAARLAKISSSKSPHNGIQPFIYFPLIRYYLATGNYRSARKYCALNELHWQKLNFPNNIEKNYHLWYRADSCLGDTKQELLHYRKYITIRDSLFNKEKSKQISELQIQYETEKKEQNIQLLTKQAQLKETQLERVKLTKNIIIGGAVMLAILLGLGYNRYRLKQRSNRLLEAQQKEISQKNSSLSKLLEEKEWLIKEIHHRVKNNLQIVISLLNTQSHYLDNEAAVAAIIESQHRMQAMSLIHQKLYQSENVTSVDMLVYISELVNYLQDSYDTGHRILFSQDVERIDLDVSQAIPVGLILNEAITNAIKYAFPCGATGTITIVMNRAMGNNILLSISDNGIGMVDDTNKVKNNSLGMSLMKGLASQLGGTFTIYSSNGFKNEIEFPYV